MFNRWAALVVVLALCALTPDRASGQVVPKPVRPGGKFGQNFPNPFNPETTIPFFVGPDDGNCSDTRKQYAVTIRIFNVFAQSVANPKLQGPLEGVGTTGFSGRRVENLRLTCGWYTAFFDGK